MVRRNSRVSSVSSISRIADTVRAVFVERTHECRCSRSKCWGPPLDDIQLVDGQTRGVVVEVDGPSHFLRVDTDRSTLGLTGALDCCDNTDSSTCCGFCRRSWLRDPYYATSHPGQHAQKFIENSFLVCRLRTR